MSHIYYAVASFLLSFLISVSLTPVAAIIARRYKIVAKPGGRRIHKRVTPLLGGIAIYAGVVLTILVFLCYFFYIGEGLSSLFVKQIIGILIGGTAIAISGVIDDKYELSGKIQLVVMIMAGFLLAIFNVNVGFISNPFLKEVDLVVLSAFLSISITVIWTTVVTKAVDCIDGMDGLCAGFCFITSMTFTIMAVTRIPVAIVNPFLVPMTAAVAGSSLGFLVYNFPPAKIFMGTVGSQFLGFMLAAISILGAYKVTIFGILAPLLILGIPVFDTTYVVFKRVSEKRGIGEADRTHIHHRLSDMGNSVKKVVLTIYLLTIVLCIVALYLFLVGK